MTRSNLLASTARRAFWPWAETCTEAPLADPYDRAMAKNLYGSTYQPPMLVWTLGDPR